MPRELERKYVVTLPKTQSGVDETIRKAFSIRSTEIEVGMDLDIYWQIPGVDFVRLRRPQKGLSELTAKKSDKGGTTEDRIETEVYVPDYDAILEHLNLVHGQPRGSLRKSFTRFPYFGAEISTAVVFEDAQRRVFLEIEAGTSARIDSIEADLKDVLELTRVHESMFQLFINKA